MCLFQPALHAFGAVHIGGSRSGGRLDVPAAVGVPSVGAFDFTAGMLRAVEVVYVASFRIAQLDAHVFLGRQSA